METTRRDFFGVIAAPLFRRFAPPVPVAAAFPEKLERYAPPLFQPTILIVKPGMEKIAREILGA